MGEVGEAVWKPWNNGGEEAADTPRVTTGKCGTSAEPRTKKKAKRAQKRLRVPEPERSWCDADADGDCDGADVHAALDADGDGDIDFQDVRQHLGARPLRRPRCPPRPPPLWSFPAPRTAGRC